MAVVDLQKITEQQSPERRVVVEGEELPEGDHQQAQAEPGQEELPQLFAEKGGKARAVDIDIARREGEHVQIEGRDKAVELCRHKLGVVGHDGDHGEEAGRVDPFDPFWLHWFRSLSFFLMRSSL